MVGKNFDVNINMDYKTKGKPVESVNKVNSSLQSLAKSVAAIAAVTASLVLLRKGFKAVTDAALIQDKAEKNLDLTLKLLNIGTDQSSQGFFDLAASLQKVTTFGDEAILGAQNILLRFTKSEEATRNLSEGVLDLSSALGLDLNAAAQLIGKTVSSSTNALTRYGVEVEGAAGSSERAESVVRALSEAFGGAARVEVQNYAGVLKQTSNTFGDLKEVLGNAFLPVMKAVSISLRILFEHIQKNIKGGEGLTKIAGEMVNGFFFFLKVIEKLVPVFEFLFEFFKSLVGQMKLIFAITFKIIDAFKKLAAIGKKLASGFKSLITGSDGLTESVGTTEKSVKGLNEEAKKTVNIFDEVRLGLIEASKPVDFSKVQPPKLSGGGGGEGANSQLVKNKEEENAAIAALDARKRALAIETGKITTQAQIKELNQRLVDLQGNADQSIEIQTQTFDTQQELATLNEELNKARQQEQITSFQDGLNTMLNSKLTVDKLMKTSSFILSNSIASGFKAMYKDMSKVGEAFAETFKNLTNNMIDGIIEKYVQLAVQFVLTHNIMETRAKIFEGLTKAREAALGAASAAASAFKAVPFPFNFAAAAAAAVAAGALIKGLFASGDRGFAGGMALVGEKGPELVNLPGGSDVLNNQETKTMLESSPAHASNMITVINNFNNNSFLGAIDEVTDLISDKIFSNIEDAKLV